MRRFVDGVDRGQATLFPGVPWGLYRRGHPVRVVDAFVDSLNLSRLGFEGVTPEATGRPSYQPSVLLKHYVYGYLIGFNQAAGLSARLCAKAVIAVAVKLRGNKRRMITRSFRLRSFA